MQTGRTNGVRSSDWLGLGSIYSNPDSVPSKVDANATALNRAARHCDASNLQGVFVCCVLEHGETRVGRLDELSCW